MYRHRILKNKHLNILAGLIVTHIISFIIVAVLSMHLGLLGVLGTYVALLSWWAWPYRELGLTNNVLLIVAIATPIIMSTAIAFLLSFLIKKFELNILAAVLPYYVIGTIYYHIKSNVKPDIDITLTFTVWFIIILISIYISKKIVLRK